MKTLSININSLTTRNVVTMICGIWLTYLLILGVLQISGLPFGFMVWPMGEDLNWMRFIRDGHGIGMTHLFWQMNDRNPLSAWWWFIASPIVKNVDWGIYAVRKCVDPFLAIVTYMVLDRLGRQQCRTFAFSTALIVLMWNFSNYYEQIMWEFLVALGFSLLSIFFYCRYVDNQRKVGHDLALAMICYFVAFTTYTLQSGAIIVIACLAFFRSANSLSLLERLKNTARDASFFLALFVLYDCIWYTVNRNSAVYYTFDWSSFFSYFFVSAKQFIFHATYPGFLRSTWNDWSIWALCLMFASAFIGFYFILFKLGKRMVGTGIKIPLGWVCVVLLAIALPTMILEATNTTWGYGSRTPMAQQVWQPIFYMSILFFIANLIPYKNSAKLQKRVLFIVALFGAMITTIALDYNYHLSERTHYQQVLAKGLKALPIANNVAPHFILKVTDMTNEDLNTVTPWIPDYGPILLKNKNISLHSLSRINDLHLGSSPYLTIHFGSDEKGVINGANIGDSTPVPYKNIWIVFFDGKKVWVPSEVSEKDLEGFRITWERNNPINQTEKVG